MAITVPAYLQNSNKECILLCEISAYWLNTDGSKYQVYLKLSSAPYTDTTFGGGNACPAYAPIIKNLDDLRQVLPSMAGGIAESSWGKLELADYQHPYLVQPATYGGSKINITASELIYMSFQLKLVGPKDKMAYSDALLIATGLVDKITRQQNQAVVHLKANAKWLDKQIPYETYPASSSYAEVRGKPKPRGFGKLKNVSPVKTAENETVFIYPNNITFAETYELSYDAATAGYGFTVDAVYDGGIKLTEAADGSADYTVTTTGFYLNNTPGKAVTCDIRFNDATRLYPMQAIKLLVEFYGHDYGEFNFLPLTVNIEENANFDFSLHIREFVSLRSLVESLLKQIPAGMAYAPDGNIRLFLLTDTFATDSGLVLDNKTYLEQPVYEDEPLFFKNIAYSYDPNLTVIEPFDGVQPGVNATYSKQWLRQAKTQRTTGDNEPLYPLETSWYVNNIGDIPGTMDVSFSLGTSATLIDFFSVRRKRIKTRIPLLSVIPQIKDKLTLNDVEKPGVYRCVGSSFSFKNGKPEILLEAWG